MNKKILITSFEPFGLGKLLFKKNKSNKIAKNIAEKTGGYHQYLVLPVSKRCEVVLQKKVIEEKICGIVLLGEDLFSLNKSINIEPFAINAELYSTNGGKVHSSFANYYAKENNLTLNSRIGCYYCNRLYLKALNLRPQTSVFLHIPYIGNGNNQMKDVMRVRNVLETHILQQNNK